MKDLLNLIPMFDEAIDALTETPLRLLGHKKYDLKVMLPPLDSE